MAYTCPFCGTFMPNALAGPLSRCPTCEFRKEQQEDQREHLRELELQRRLAEEHATEIERRAWAAEQARREAEAARRRQEEFARDEERRREHAAFTQRELKGLAKERAGSTANCSPKAQYSWLKSLHDILARYNGPKGYYVFPYAQYASPPTKKLANATKSCAVPQSESILALLDTTFWGSAKDCLLFGCEGIYFHNGRGGFGEFSPKQRGAGHLPYRQFRGRAFSYSWFHSNISLGDDKSFHLGNGLLGKSQIVEILNAIQALVNCETPPSSDAMHTSYKIIVCKKCPQKLRIPSMKETLTVSCPACKHRFDYP